MSDRDILRFREIRIINDVPGTYVPRMHSAKKWNLKPGTNVFFRFKISLQECKMVVILCVASVCVCMCKKREPNSKMI